MATLEKEDFWGCELKKGSTEVKFNPEFEDSELSEVEHKLILSQACLGAKASGRCLVQVTSRDYKGEENKHVIVSLQSGSTEMVCNVEIY
ncbi:hypothetical protein QZH41_013729 [Actinostola sp. cb2023]|nr:hypothetical protein QZH41_013729 [Actinostola sp. cb2023]